MKRILFVCTGNTCRSCMAEGIFKDLIEKDVSARDSFTAASAGLTAFDGDNASENAIRALKDEWAIDIGCHRARRLNEREIKEADLVLTMTRNHKDSILSVLPEAKSKVFTLKEYVYSKGNDPAMREYNYALDILDPYGMPLNVYKKCARDLRETIGHLIKKLKESS
ncbi:MAG: low molecular weight protein arginine phosphatase [Clostridia bacterium]|nr:low molecular weight protein arginine phosphatase [Clostridia bacterium]